jgi:cytoskeletal protein CcmA (bactofilin family)
MALFSKKLDNTKSKEAVKPATLSISTVEAQGAQIVLYEEVHPPSRTSAPAALAGDVPAYLDKGSKITGKLMFEGSVRIEGQVDGEISANDAVVIGKTAVVTAQLKAASVVIAGKVSGDIIAAKRVEIRPKAQVLGKLTTPVLVVHDGALFEGRCTMNPEPKEDRKVTPIAPKEERVIPQAAVAGNKLA